MPSPAGFASDSNFKDLYARFSYRFNLEREGQPQCRTSGRSNRAPRPHLHQPGQLLLITAAPFSASAEKTLPAIRRVLTVREPFYRAGGDFSVNYRTLNVYGLFMYGHDTESVTQWTPPARWFHCHWIPPHRFHWDSFTVLRQVSPVASCRLTT